jgi:hypothetical protein
MFVIYAARLNRKDALIGIGNADIAERQINQLEFR